jgi:hypothetical protein
VVFLAASSGPAVQIDMRLGDEMVFGCVEWHFISSFCFCQNQGQMESANESEASTPSFSSNYCSENAPAGRLPVAFREERSSKTSDISLSL